jgi:hypothetical protein
MAIWFLKEGDMITVLWPFRRGLGILARPKPEAIAFLNDSNEKNIPESIQNAPGFPRQLDYSISPGDKKISGSKSLF